MTDDHIPPQSCGNKGDYFYSSFFPRKSTEYNKNKFIHSQNGIKFRFICGKCNSLLGSAYDRDLCSFRQTVINLIDPGKKTHVNSFKIENVVRSIVGHILASSEYEESVPDVEMREYFDGYSDMFLEKYSLLVYCYPFKENIVILKEYCALPVKKQSLNAPEGVLTSLYFYPFAFILTEKHLADNDMLNALRESEQQVFRIDSWGERSPDWPMDGTHAVFLSQAAANSVCKKK